MRITLAVALVALIPAAWAQGILALSDETLADLPDNARTHFTQAREALGRREYVDGFRLLRQAASEAENSAPLQLALAQIASRMAQTQFQSEAPRLLAEATQACERALASPTASEANIARARELLEGFGATQEAIDQIAEQARQQAEREAQGREILRQAAAEAEQRRSAAEQTVSPTTPDTTPAPPANSRRYLQAIQDARDLRDASNP